MPAWLVLLAALVMTFWVCFFVKHDIETEALNQLSDASDQIALKVRERLESYDLILRGGAGVFAASDGVTRREWRAFVERVRADETVPGVQGIGFSELIPAVRLDAHVARIRSEGFPGYRVWPDGKRDVYTAIVYLEPFRDRNLRAFGYDMYSEPIRREAMAAAMDSGKTTLSGRVKLVQETESDVQAGVLMYVPVYREGMPTGTVAERRQAMIGWTYSPYRMNDLMAGTMAYLKLHSSIRPRLYIYDGEVADAQSLLYASDKSTQARDGWLRQQRTVEFNGRKWLLDIEQDVAIASIDFRQFWWALAGGCTISGLLFWLTLSLYNTRFQAKRIANKLTRDIQDREAWIVESEQRWKMALEASGLGVWDWNVAAGKVRFSLLWKSMLGYAEHEIGDDLEEWKTRVHPDDLPATLAMVNDCLEGRIEQYDSHHRLHCKDGSYIWIRDRGRVMERDSTGKPLRMIGTHSDITDLKILELDRERYRSFFRLATEPMAIADPFGCFLQVNPAMMVLTGYEESELVAKPFMEFVHPDDRERTMEEMRKQVALRPSMEFENRYVCKDGSVVHLSWTAFHDQAEGVTYATARDVTAQKQAEAHLHRINRLYQALSACNMAILHCRSRRELYERICTVVVDSAGMKMAWIGEVDQATGAVVSVASQGKGVDYLDGIRISIRADDPHGRGPTGIALRENHPVWFNDFLNDPATAPWHERGARYGWGSSAALPIRCNGVPVAALTFYSAEVGWMDADVRTLLEEMADDLSYALEKLDAEAAARSAYETLTESEQRFRMLVEQSIAGAFISQDGRFVYVNPRLCEILGHAADDELIGLATEAVVAPRSREMMMPMIKAFREGRQGQVRVLFTALRKDGSEVDVAMDVAHATYHQRPAAIGLVQDISDRKIAEEQIRRYASKLEEMLMRTVGMATALVEMRDPYTVGHEKRVAEIAVAIGREMGLDEERLRGLEIGGHLHDVGKVVVPSEILSKPSRISDVEYSLIKQHPQAGYDILKEVEFPWPVARIALEHHERYDGTGYPNGLKGEAILLEARITAVADTVEAMASHRPYRAGLGIEKALAEVERGSGTAFDPEVTAACLRLFREKAYVLPQRIH